MSVLSYYLLCRPIIDSILCDPNDLYNVVIHSSVMRILPRHLRELIHIPDISLVHKTLHGVSPMAANIKFLDVVRHWPLYGATFFEITVSRFQKKIRSVSLGFVIELGTHIK